MNRFCIPFVCILLFATSAWAQAPAQMQYQGYLADLDGTPVHCPSLEDCPAGPFSLTVRFYDVATEGLPFWEETHNDVVIQDGMFTLRLGSVSPIEPHTLPGDLWLSMAINDTPEALPRQRVVSAAFAMRASEAGIAQDADALGGIPAADYPTKSELPGLCVTEEALAETLANKAPDYTNADVEVVLVDGAYVQLADLAAVAITGNYLDLSNTPAVLDELTVNEFGDLVFAGKPVLNGIGEWIGEPTGLVGPQGDKGEKGDKGDKGDTGDTGATGDTGPKGEPGVDGKDGFDGVSVSVAQVNSAGELVVILSDGTVSTSESLIGPQGPAGADGADGADGANGADGTDGQDGAQGIQGVAGPTGAPGVDALIDVLNEPPGDTCSAGGVLIRAGQDLNADGVLQGDEVTSSQYVCNGADGADGADGGSSGTGTEDIPAFAFAPPVQCTVAQLNAAFFDNTLGIERICNGQVWVPQSGACGNGVVDPGEECDDGNLTLGDSCANCIQTSPSLCAQTCNSAGSLSGYGESIIQANDAGDYDHFGESISMSGDTLVVGAYEDDDNGSNAGSAYVFIKEGNEWTLQQKLTASDGTNDDNFGWSVSIDGDYIVVGSRYEDDAGSNAGAAYVFKRNGTVWSETQKLTALDASSNDNFGFAVGISNITIMIGSPYDDDKGSNSGSAYVYTRSGNNWNLQQKLTASDGLGNDNFGFAVAVDGTRLVVGSPNDDDNGSDKGSIHIYDVAGAAWLLEQKVLAPNGQTNDEFGFAVASSNGTVVVGAPYCDAKGNNSGCAYAFVKGVVGWTALPPILPLNGMGDAYFGYSVAIDGDTLLVGATRQDVDDENNQGTAYVFALEDGAFEEQTSLIASNGAQWDEFGTSVAISGSDLAISARNAGTNERGMAYVDQLGALCSTEGDCVCDFGYGQNDCSELLTP